jgi:hypothetical protein
MIWEEAERANKSRQQRMRDFFGSPVSCQILYTPQQTWHIYSRKKSIAYRINTWLITNERIALMMTAE